MSAYTIDPTLLATYRLLAELMPQARKHGLMIWYIQLDLKKTEIHEQIASANHTDRFNPDFELWLAETVSYFILERAE